MQDTTPAFLIIGATFLLAGLVKGVTGMGLPTVVMGILGLIMAPVQAAALLVIPSLVTNVWQLFAGASVTPLLRRFATMMIGVCVGTFAGIRLLAGESSGVTSAALGLVLAVYGVIGLTSARFMVPPGAEKWLSPTIGLITGALTGATGIFVVPAVPYLGSLPLSRQELIQALGLSFTVSTLALALGLASHGQFQTSHIGVSSLAVLPALGGMLLGQWIRTYLKPEVFRRWFFASLVVLGLYMLQRAFLYR
jgi:uncharacterized membrane protein YfcA